MKKIPLSKGHVAIVDDEDYEAVNRYKWFANVAGGGRVYAARRLYLGGGRKNAKRATLYMHRFLMEPADDMDVDHINGNSLDNRRANMRVCTRSENILNSANARGKGVWHCQTTGRWAARMSHDGERHFLGRYDTEAEARAAITAARRVLGVQTEFN